jgi:hypothetical protein
MDGIGAAIDAALKWVTDDRKLRTALITIVVFGLLAAALEYYQLVKRFDHEWFLLVYVAAVFAILLLTVAVFDLIVVKIYSKLRIRRKKEE